MASKLLEMRHWAVESSDDKEALLRHKDGHEMRVALRSLPRLQQEQIKRIKMAEGGQPKKKEDNYAASPVNNLDPDKAAALRQALSPTPEPSSTPQPAAPGYDEGGEVADNSGDTKHGDVHITINSGNPVDQAKQVLSSPSNQSQPTASPSAATPQPATQPAPQPYSPEQAQGAQVGAYGEFIKKQQELAKQNADNFNDVKQHADEFSDYIKANPINPLAYQESQSAEQKTNTAIGLLLGGIGGAGHGNAALDFLNKQIDRNVAAQEKNAENRNTVWGAYQHLYDDSKVASDLARASQLDILSNKISMAALKIGTPQAQANAQQFSQMAQQDRNSALQSASQNLSNKQSKGEENPYSFTPIITPDAENRVKQAQLNPLLTNQYPQIKEQYQAAQQADRSLGQASELFNHLTKETGGVSGRVHRMGQKIAGLGGGAGAAIGALAGGPTGAAIGAGVGSAAGEGVSALTNTAENRASDADYRALATHLSAAIPASAHISQQTVDELIRANAPETGDRPEDIKKKWQNIVDTIQSYVPRGFIGSGGANLLNKP